MADVFTLNGEAFTPPDDAPAVNGMAAYLRDLADHVERGIVQPQALIVVMALPANMVTVQRIGSDAYSAIGLLAVAQRVAMGV